MAFNHQAHRQGPVTQMQRDAGPKDSAQEWKELTTRRAPSPHIRQRRIIILVSIFLLFMLIFAALRLSMVVSETDDQLIVHVDNQQPATVDLRQSFPISTDLLGTNIFPQSGSSSLDQPFSGFMPNTSLMRSSIQDMHVKLMRFPGGDWGEKHILSLNQLSQFSAWLAQTNGDGMIQAHLSGPIADQNGDPQPHDLSADLNTRANLAGRWVDYMNNPKSDQRTGAHQNDPFHPVALWTVGNEPDRQINPLTGQIYTVADYVNAFIQFSKAMHQNDPKIKVFGPELSQFYGIGAGPFDAGGHPWMDDFLKGVGTYEQQHPELPYHLLDGISFHRYQFDNAHQAPGLLMSSANEWDFLLPPLRAQIKQDLKRDIPIAITEINTNPKDQVPSRGQAALWWADTLGTLMNQQVEDVAFFSTAGVDKPYPLFTQDGLHETPMARVMELFSHLQNNLVPLSIQQEPVSTYATQDRAHQTVSLLFVNKSATPTLVQIRSANQWLSVSPWHDQDISLAGYSMVVVTLHRNGGATAYSYIAPPTDDATVTPLTYTVCGNKTDALANFIPC